MGSLEDELLELGADITLPPHHRVRELVDARTGSTVSG